MEAHEEEAGGLLAEGVGVHDLGHWEFFFKVEELVGVGVQGGDSDFEVLIRLG